jgi:hypothetical protein
MTVTELTNEQMIELKQNYLTEHMAEVEDRTPSYEELARADDIVPNWLIFDIYESTEFSFDDFFCTGGDNDEEEHHF